MQAVNKITYFLCKGMHHTKKNVKGNILQPCLQLSLATKRTFPCPVLLRLCRIFLRYTSLATRSWACPDCGVVHDRDANAARNILAEWLRVLSGEEQLPADCREITPVRSPRGDDMKLAGKGFQRRNPSSREVGIPCL